MSDDDIRAPGLRDRDFLGVFAVVRRGNRLLMVQNERIVAGAGIRTWDLPGGQVEPGELLEEALARELREETGLALSAPPAFLFVQEGERTSAGARRYAWRSFFFACEVEGEPQPGAEVLAVRWFEPDAWIAQATAPYHDSVRTWLRSGGHFFGSRWEDQGSG